MTKHYPLLDSIGFIELVDKSGIEAALKVVNAARISYNKRKDQIDEQDTRLLQYLWKAGHHSPFRHTHFTFHIKAPLYVFRQWVKYQVDSSWKSYEISEIEVPEEDFFNTYEHVFSTDSGCSWNEISGRYVKLKKEFYIPLKFRTNSGHANKQKSSNLDWPESEHVIWRHKFRKACEAAYSEYELAVKEGISREQARGLLPQSMYTEVYWTVSLQAILHFLKQRLESDAQWEIQQYAKAILDLVENELPIDTLNKREQ